MDLDYIRKSLVLTQFIAKVPHIDQARVQQVLVLERGAGIFVQID